jgi:ubiquinone/menaquinone biosynthesis C-methylase UbiE
MSQTPKKAWDVFNRDIEDNRGYLYTATDGLSSRLATQRSTDAILALDRFRGRRVLDLGCGDGFYTFRFWDAAQPSEMVAVDAAEKAVEAAMSRRQDRPIRFEVGDAHDLDHPDDSFDIVLIQSILHHDDRPADMIREAFRLAPEIVIHEPNGNNPGLKMIERVSPYHREHAEKSYSSRSLRRWVEAAGGRVVEQRFAGFVPMFSPEPLARLMKRLEPLVEAIPGVRALGCSVCVQVAERVPKAAF